MASHAIFGDKWPDGLLKFLIQRGFIGQAPPAARRQGCQGKQKREGSKPHRARIHDTGLETLAHSYFCANDLSFGTKNQARMSGRCYDSRESRK